MRGAAAGAAAGSSPHTRGAHVGDAGMIAIVGIIPAYAGSTHLVLAPLVAGPGSSPHTRGAHFEVVVDPIQLGIIPAYVGSTPATRPAPRRCEDHPRIRGEHGKASFYDGLPSGSSPHTRGAPPPTQVGVETTGIIPAYAGSTRARDDQGPRHGGSSPHTRGAQMADEAPDEENGIIPAYAGSTGMTRRIFAATWDHPRIRGEHGTTNGPGDFGGGSSPHTRGAHRRAARGLVLDRIIPAYAGST